MAIKIYCKYGKIIDPLSYRFEISLSKDFKDENTFVLIDDDPKHLIKAINELLKKV